ncbi:DNA polymerase III subunit epsilon [Psychromonas marina]|uniref:DNA polymerase III subunit epsilon n=1 Tax=Psychromonas marina TaxID=88364 RepID=A0ABQ6E5K7_9GAMM|nr:3'-5' exonuclease [Psychromonas marina]GLS92696.1 DNA polymerase III subunit epsilon [Psychromonas marina]
MVPLFNYYHALNKLKRKRERYISKYDLPDNIKSLLKAPLPGLDDDLFEVDYVALDFETTGFYPEQDQILSVGYLPLSNQKILVSEAAETFIKSSEKIKAETAVINHIVPEMLEKGLPLDEVMDMLFSAITGKVLIAHGCIIEKRFLDYYIAKHFQLPPLPLLWVDTLSIEKSLTMHKGTHKSADFRLASTRARHGLPEYSAHGALIDALATAELYLALLKKRFAGTKASFRHLKIE